MNKTMTQMIKGIAILIMLAHHFIVMPLSIDFPYLILKFGNACKICVAIYAVLSGYGYYYAKDKSFKYSLRKIWGLLRVYWISLFTLFVPLAILGGWNITPWNIIVQLFGLLPNLNWFAWYVFFYIFCMLVAPIVYKFLNYKPLTNLLLSIFVPYIFEVLIHSIPNYDHYTLIKDLMSCCTYFPCFLVGYWMAENLVIEKSRYIKVFNNTLFSIIGIGIIVALRFCIASVFGFLFDVIYVPILICFINVLFSHCSDYSIVKMLFLLLGKYSTGIWFFHAVFFSTYVSDIFAPILTLVKNPALMYIWLVILSLSGAIFYQKILDVFDLFTTKLRSA